MEFSRAFRRKSIKAGLLSAVMAAAFCGQAQAGVITAENIATGTNASLKITDVSSGSKSGSVVPGTLFWYINIGEGDTFDAAKANAINLWGAQSSSGSTASRVFFGVFAGEVTPRGLTVPDPYNPLRSIEFQVNECPLSNGSYSCNQFQWKPELLGLNLNYAAGAGNGKFTIAVYSETPADIGGNGNVWKTSTKAGMTLTDTDGTAPQCVSCQIDRPEQTFEENIPLPGSAALVALGLLGLGAARRKTA